MTKKCPICKVDFNAPRKKAIYCSVKCRGIKQSQSRKTKVCPVCKDDFYAKGSATVCCSIKCQGIRHSKVLKNKWKNKEYRANQTKIRNSKSWKKKLSRRSWGWWRYTKKGRRLRNKLKRKQTYFYKVYYYKGIKMRSTWEVKYARYLDKMGIKWKYEPKTFKVTKSGRCYTPDFYLTKEKEYVEIKGRFHKKDRKKIRRFRRKFPNVKFNLLQKTELKHLGVKI